MGSKPKVRPNCPTPAKLRFGTQLKAQERVVTGRFPMAMEAYLCRCGLWHLRTAAKQREYE